MKPAIILIILSLFFLASCGQTKSKLKPKHTKKEVLEQKDSTYFEHKNDTTYGTVEYKTGNGTVIGEAILVNTEVWKFYKPVPEQPDTLIEIGKDTIWVWQGTTGQLQYEYSDVFIKTSKGYISVREKYVFKPKLD